MKHLLKVFFFYNLFRYSIFFLIDFSESELVIILKLLEDHNFFIKKHYITYETNKN